MSSRIQFETQHLLYLSRHGLKIIDLESDQELQDIILSIHHALMLMFSKATKAVKIVENHIGQALINCIQ